MVSDDPSTDALEVSFHKAIKKVSSDIEETKFNTAIATLMALTNTVYSAGKLSKEQLEIFIKLLCPFAPHLTEEIWESLGHEDFLSVSAWPQYEEEKTVDATIEIGVQVNGKVRGTVLVAKDEDKDAVLARAKEIVADKLTGNIVKEIYVPGKIVNIVQK